MKKFRLVVILLLSAITFLIFGNDDKDDIHTIRILIPKIALLDIESVNAQNITLKMLSPSESGDPLMSASDNRIWLNVTSVIESIPIPPLIRPLIAWSRPFPAPFTTT